jgi:class 3 adenylate cyclase
MKTDESSIESVRLCAVDHASWQAVQAGLQRRLDAYRIGQLFAPTTLILHDILESATRVMHLQLFSQAIDADFTLASLEEQRQIESLFAAEIAEHGFQNIAHACREGGRMITVQFPSPAAQPSVLAQVLAPFDWDSRLCRKVTLIAALGYQLDVEAISNGSRISLTRIAEPPPAATPPALLDDAAQSHGVAQIARQLDYGLIQFSATGEIVTVSPSILTLLRLEADSASAGILAKAIPLNFLNDIVWGFALDEGNGAFENYRIRLRMQGTSHGSILFNVSGYREDGGIVNSLWQTVSLDDSGAMLAEGAMLSEVRIHNITRNYVPQLVEQKARLAVHLGQTSLRNEERPVAVLFCDIVGFTSYVECNAASESTIDTLNSVLRRVSASVKQNRGFIDKFMGDSAMAIFYDPADAVLAALDMQRHSEDINTLRSRAGQQTLPLRIGIDWGEVVLGNVGTAERLDWTAIGDVVNTASRIEKACDPGSILISQAVRDAVESRQPGQFRFDPTFGIKVKGKADELVVCHVRQR